MTRVAQFHEPVSSDFLIDRANSEAQAVLVPFCHHPQPFLAYHETLASHHRQRQVQYHGLGLRRRLSAMYTMSGTCIQLE